MTPTERLAEWLWLGDGGVRPDIAASRLETNVANLRKVAHRIRHRAALDRLDKWGTTRREAGMQERMATHSGNLS